MIFYLLYSLLWIMLSDINHLDHFYFKIEENIIDNINNKTYKYWENLTVTKHFWTNDIENIQNEINSVNTIILNKLGHEFYNLRNMDELYFSAVNNSNSDLSFVNLHTDGPFYFCNVYRVLVFINGNRNIDTVINRNLLFNLQKYDVIGFDYHNDLHYIKNNGNFLHDNNKRIILKMHYSKKYYNCGQLTINYNKFARDLFEYNKFNMKNSGNIMLFVQKITAFRKEFFILNFILYFIFSFSHKKMNKFINLYNIGCFSLILFHILFISNFIFSPKETKWF